MTQLEGQVSPAALQALFAQPSFDDKSTIDPNDAGVLIAADGRRHDGETGYPIGDLTQYLVGFLPDVCRRFGFEVALIRKPRVSHPQDAILEKMLSTKAPTHESAYELRRQGELLDTFATLAAAMSVVWGVYLHSCDFNPPEGKSLKAALQKANKEEEKGGGIPPASLPAEEGQTEPHIEDPSSGNLHIVPGQPS